MEVVNAKIKNTFLGFEDHRIPTAQITLEWSGGCQGFGGYDLRSWGISWITRLMSTIGLEQWEKLPGQIVRIRREDEMIVAIGNVLSEQWFDPRTDVARPHKA